MKVWLVYEESSHEDAYETQCDGRFVVGVYSSEGKAREAMSVKASAVPVGENDTHDVSAFRIETSKWSVCGSLTPHPRLVHECDWEWSMEEREVE